MIEIGHKYERVVKTRKVTAEGKLVMVPKYAGGDHPLTVLVANEPVRLTKGVLNGHFCRDSGRKLVVKLRTGDLLEMRPQGCRKGTYTASLFDIYSWMIKSQANQVKMAKLRDTKAKKAEARALRRLHRRIRSS